MLAGCSEVAVVDGAAEPESLRATRLLESAGVTATRTPSSQAGAWRVNVPVDEVPRAVAALQAVGGAPDGPREGRPVLEGLASERARLDRAHGEALARTLEQMEGVRWARVHLGEEGAPRLDEPVAPAARRAAVVLQPLGDVGPDPRAVQQVVAAAVRGLSPERVSVHLVPPPRTTQPAPLQHVGPFRVAPASAAPLRAALALLLATNITLAALVLWHRRRHPRNAPSAPTG